MVKHTPQKRDKGPRVDPKDRVPLIQKLSYGAGGVVNPFIDFSQGWMLLFMTQAFGISAGWITTAGGIFRAWDAINDPIIGSISDNCRSRFGRRRPFIVVGAILFGFSMPLLWSLNNDWPESVKIIYMIIAGLILYTTASIWALPYQSLAVELTSDTNERTRVMGVKTLFSYAAGLINFWLPKLAAMSFFAGPVLANGLPNIGRGVFSVSWILCFLVIGLGALPGIFCKERYFEGGLTRKQERIPILTSIKQTFSCGPFWILTLMMLTQVIGALLVGNLGFFVSRFYVCEGDYVLAAEIFAITGTIGQVVGLCSVPFWVWISEKFGKRHAISLVVIIGMLGKLSVIPFYTPENPWLMVFPQLLFSFGGAAMWMIVPSMLGDVVDYDELKNGVRREGNFSAVFLFFIKVGVTLSTVASGWIMVIIGFDETAAMQTLEVASGLKNAFVFIPVVVWIACLVLIQVYPLDSVSISANRKALEERRGAI